MRKHILGGIAIFALLALSGYFGVAPQQYQSTTAIAHPQVICFDSRGIC